jgi:hypothetical protein
LTSRNGQLTLDITNRIIHLDHLQDRTDPFAIAVTDIRPDSFFFPESLADE